MITATVRFGDNYADIEFPCSDSYLRAKLMELHAGDPDQTTLFLYDMIEPGGTVVPERPVHQSG